MFIQVLVTLFLTTLPKTNADEKMETYLYMLKRNQIKLNEDRLLMNKTIKESIVNLYFQYLKTKEIKNDNKYFYYPIENNIEFIQKNSTLYKFLRKMPKGANLYLNEFQELDRSKLIDLITESADSQYLYICDQLSKCKNMEYFMNYFMRKKSVPAGWTKFNETKMSKQEIVEKTTLIGLLQSSKSRQTAETSFSQMRFNLASDKNLFLVYKNITEYKKTYFGYLKAVLDASLDENVQMVELRRHNFGNLWSYTKSGNRESIPVFEELEGLSYFKKEYMEKNPNFIDFSFVIVGPRSQPNFEIDAIVESSIKYNRRFPNLVRGFDLVQDNDNNEHSLLYHRDSLIKAQNYGKNESAGTFHLYVHDVEKAFADTQLLYYNKDDAAITENIYDAIILQVIRLGQGLGYINHPQLYDTLIKNDIAIELCVTSNHLMGFTPDIRNHPGKKKTKD
jgi:hypothetical protein